MTTNLFMAIACGGTGGHFYPTLSIAKEFIGRGGKVTLLVAGNHAAEQLALAAEQGIPAIEVPTVRLPAHVWQWPLFPFRMLSCRKAARKVLDSLKPDILLGMGSFASVPQCLAASADMPMFLHEGNAFMGKANRWLIRMKRIAGVTLSLPLADEGQLHGVRSRFVGMPLREAIVAAARNPLPQGEYLASLGLEPGRKTILVFGGSQGARFINGIFAGVAPLLKDVASQFQIIHLTGTDDNEALVEAYRNAGIRSSVRRSEPNIHLCYQAADIVFCRSGASSLCELALFRKPLFLIPLPTAADNHQFVNAKLLENAKAAKLCEQKHLDEPWLAAVIRDWLANGDQWNAAAKNLARFAKPNAAADAVDFMLETLHPSNEPPIGGNH